MITKTQQVQEKQFRFFKLLRYKFKRKKIGLPKEYMIEGLNPEIESTWNQALDWFKKKVQMLLKYRCHIPILLYQRII